MKNKKQYNKPEIKSHGSIEQVTGWIGGGCGEFFGGANARRNAFCMGFKNKHDLGS